MITIHKAHLLFPPTTTCPRVTPWSPYFPVLMKLSKDGQKDTGDVWYPLLEDFPLAWPFYKQTTLPRRVLQE